jgi:hypothetical protein
VAEKRINKLKLEDMKIVQSQTLRLNRWFAGRMKTTLSALLVALVALASSARADQGDERRGPTPELPSPVCDDIAVPAGHKLSSHMYAFGVQIYRWSGSAWVFVAPEATLFADACYGKEVGTHYAGPTWEANDGSTVVGARLEDCAPYPGAIPWLLLRASANTGHGRFARVTYIQRVNTIGGTAPSEVGTFVGQEARVPYTTEYLFYRVTKH